MKMLRNGISLLGRERKGNSVRGKKWRNESLWKSSCKVNTKEGRREKELKEE